MFRMRGLLLQALPVSLQRSQQSAVVCVLYAGLHQDDQIQTLECLSMSAEAFPDQPLDAISVNRPADVLLGYRQTQSGSFPLVIKSCEHGKIAIRGSYRPGEYLFIVPGSKQPGMTGKTFGRDKLTA